MASTDTLLANAHHCLLAYVAGDGPQMAPAACWSDGGGLWLTASRRSAAVAALRRDPRCAVWIAPPATSDPGVAIDGSARIYDLSDPVGLTVHAATISAAVAALALRHGAEIAGYAWDARGTPRRWLPWRRVLIRVRIDRARARAAPQQATGVGPALPVAVPSGVRRALAGVRHVALALRRGDTLTVQPAVWGAGYRLDMGPAAEPPPGAPACVAAWRHTDARPSRNAGLVLRGTVDSGMRLHPAHATWWEGLREGSAELSDPLTPSGIVLPD